MVVDEGRKVADLERSDARYFVDTCASPLLKKGTADLEGDDADRQIIFLFWDEGIRACPDFVES